MSGLEPDADDLLAVDLVTADGQLLRVDADSHPDLGRLADCDQ